MRCCRLASRATFRFTCRIIRSSRSSRAAARTRTRLCSTAWCCRAWRMCIATRLSAPWAGLRSETRAAMRRKTGVAQMGLAVHSLRAVPPAAMREAIQGVEAGSPLHIHAAEQTGEIDEALATLKARPVAWLLREMHADQRWCLVHA